MTQRIRAGAVSLIVLGSAAPASAHTSYMLPNLFSTANATQITLESSFAEDIYFRPEVGIDSQDFHLVRPNGQRDTFDNIAKLKQLTVLESDLTEAGTYRFSTGERLGRTSTAVLVKGKWEPLEPGQTPPKGAKTRDSQTATVAEVYVTKGAPTRAAVDAPNSRLAIHPITHPSEIYLDGGFTFELLFDGKPLANQEMSLYREAGYYEEPHFSRTVKTDAKGRVSLSFDKPGAYMIMTRHRADAPGSKGKAIRSYTTSLVFEVAR